MKIYGNNMTSLVVYYWFFKMYNNVLYYINLVGSLPVVHHVAYNSIKAYSYINYMITTHILPNQQQKQLDDVYNYYLNGEHILQPFINNKLTYDLCVVQIDKNIRLLAPNVSLDTNTMVPSNVHFISFTITYNNTEYNIKLTTGMENYYVTQNVFDCTFVQYILHHQHNISTYDVPNFTYGLDIVDSGVNIVSLTKNDKIILDIDSYKIVPFKPEKVENDEPDNMSDSLSE